MRRTSLVCVPFAGAGAAFFGPWSQLAPAGFEITALQLAGREWRIAEEPHREVAPAVAGLLAEFTAQFDSEQPVVLFGHSLGAVLAYELAHRLVAAGGVEVAHLVVSGSPGPWTRRGRRATGLAEPEFLERVREFAGYHHEALEHPELREMILPALRADVELHENYRPSTDTPLPVPITALRGRSDRLVSVDQAGEWAKATSRGFTMAEVDGGHMYLADSAGPLLRLIELAVSHG